VPEENFWTLWWKGRLTETDTPTIQLGATPSGLTSAHLRKYITYIQKKWKCGPIPNVMAALPHIGGTLCSTPQCLADAHY